MGCLGNFGVAMRLQKKHAPYSLYKKQTKPGLMWYARFWDTEAKKYSTVRSTGIMVEGKRERWREADDAAKVILEELRKSPKSIEPLPSSDEKIKAFSPFIQYLLDFWSPESEYIKYKRDVKKKPLCASYIQMNHDDVLRHVATYPDFQNISLEQLNRKLLKQWQIWMAGKKVTHIKKDGTSIEGKPLSGRRINSVLQGMRIAVRWAVDNETLLSDPFRKLDEVTEETKEKGILTLEELNKLIALPVNDPYSRLAVLLAARCGMRRGEIRGLKWGDIQDDIITIQHNYVNSDGLKSPKIKGGITVKNSSPVPLPSDVQAVLIMVKQFSNFTEDNNFVFQGARKKEEDIDKEKNISAEYFRYAFAKELKSLGINEETQKTRNLTFHGLRHTFVSLGRLAGLNSFEIQTLARHKSERMMEQYSHGKQAIDFIDMKKRLEKGIESNEKKTEEKIQSERKSKYVIC